jgi:dipeptidyl aminopeptidase/acylaminoacyl peptidase
MIKSLRLAASVVALVAAMGRRGPRRPGAGPDPTTHVFTAKDMASLDRLSDPRVSPDGRYVLYSVRTMDYPANKAAMSLWIADLKTKMAPRRLKISDGGASSGRWSADGKAIYFSSSRAGGTEQVFRTDVMGETATQVTSAPFDVQAFKVAPNGKTIVVGLAVFPDCADFACTEAKLAAKTATKAAGVVYDRLFVRHWDTWNDGTKNHLFAYTLDANGVAAGQPIDLMKGFDGDTPTKPYGGDDDFTISPDSKTVSFSAKVAGKDEPWTTNYDMWGVAAGRLGQADELHGRQQGLGHDRDLVARRQDDRLSRHEASGLRGRSLRDHDLGRGDQDGTRTGPDLGPLGRLDRLEP